MGMFFTDEELGPLKKKAALRRPPIPDTGWTPPKEMPNLSAAKVISIDTETKEKDWDHGPGWARGQVELVGFSLGARDAQGNQGKWYFPLRHEVEPEMNLDPTRYIPWLKFIVETAHIPKVFANSIYDVGTLTSEGIFVEGEIHDVEFSEALLNEDGFVALDYLGQKYLGKGKETSTLYQWCAEAYGGDANSKQRANIYRAPPRLVGPYAEMDATLPLEVLDKQWPLMCGEGLLDLYRMECDLVPLLVQMRLRGQQVDLPKAMELYSELALDLKRIEESLFTASGIYANPDSPDDLVKVFDACNIKYPRTAIGNPSFRKEFLNGLEHPVGQIIRDYRETRIVRNTFIRNYVLEGNTNGKIHCQFHPLRGDEGGARTGRFAASDPNLQNIPVRTERGKKVRKIFIPDPGHVAYGKNDYSQIEYRFLGHFATGPGSDALRQAYNANPDTDYHQNTYDRLCPYMGWDAACKDTAKLFRRPVKNINFGLLYGMGKDKLTRALIEYFKGKLTKQEIAQLFEAYHQANPYVKATMDSVALEAQTQGFTTTILNRRRRFNMWEPKKVNYDDRAMPLRYEAAINQYGAEIQRCHTHKGINSKLQGSAADIIKKGMVQCYKEGVFDVMGMPKMQVHDELTFSVPYFRGENRQYDEAHNRMIHILETCIPLRVPVTVDSGLGPNWGAID